MMEAIAAGTLPQDDVAYWFRGRMKKRRSLPRASGKSVSRKPSQQEIENGSRVWSSGEPHARLPFAVHHIQSCAHLVATPKGNVSGCWRVTQTVYLTLSVLAQDNRQVYGVDQGGKDASRYSE